MSGVRCPVMSGWRTAAACGCAALVAATGAAATVTWDGDTSTNWSNGANWVGGSAPGTGDDAVIDGGYTYAPTLDLSGGAATVRSLSLGANNTSILTIANGDMNTRKLVVTSNATIGANGVLRHADNSTAETHLLNIEVQRNLAVVAGGRIDVSGLGYDKGWGPGVSGSRNGGSYGGRGGYNWNNGGAYSATYGSYLVPVNIGSGGGIWGGGDGTSGGGAVKLAVTGDTTLDGQILSDGANAAGAFTAGGSGGSIYLAASNVIGSGLIRAKGGAGNTSASGGGGRIAIILTAGTGTGSVLLDANGGGTELSASDIGACGTVYVETNGTISGRGQLTVSNAFSSAYVKTVTAIPSGQAWSVYNLRMLGRAILGVTSNSTLDIKTPTAVSGTNSACVWVNTGTLVTPADSLEIANWSLVADGTNTLTCSNVYVRSCGIITHSAGSNDYRMFLTVNGNLTIDTGGAVNVDGKGDALGKGIGSPGTAARSGGCHGGMGGQDDYGNPLGRTYGSFLSPTNLGSGGGNWGGGEGTAGGGAIIMTVTGTTTVNGAISADAGKDTINYSAGGSGGSIYLTTAQLAGSGTIKANGEDQTSTSASGGGGRIAVYLTAGSSFGNVIFQAYGGPSATAAKCGAAGTLYRQTAGQSPGRGTLHVDDDGIAATLSTDVPPMTNGVANEATKATVILTNSCVLKLTANVWVKNIWLMSAGSTLNLNTNTLYVYASEHSLAPGAVLTNNGAIVWLGSSDGTIIELR